jgi:hypothetical protein
VESVAGAGVCMVVGVSLRLRSGQAGLVFGVQGFVIGVSGLGRSVAHARWARGLGAVAWGASVGARAPGLAGVADGKRDCVLFEVVDAVFALRPELTPLGVGRGGEPPQTRIGK